MALEDVVMGEVAKALTASMTGAGIASTGRLWQVVRRKFARQSTDELPDLAELQALLIRHAKDDPEWAAQLASALPQAVSGAPTEEQRAVFVPPSRFCDRRRLREDLPVTGVFGFAGPPGCGKTALVQQLAADGAGRFPVFCARVDLDSFRDGDVLRVAQVKRHILRQWAVTRIVTADPELSLQYLRVPLTRRVLLVVENLLGADEFHALVQFWPTALVLVTTRRLTTDLRACLPDWVELQGLDESGARELLVSRCPAALVDDEPTAVETLLTRFGRQPQAIQVLGAILSKRAGESRPVAGLLADLDRLGIGATDELLGGLLSGQVAQVPAEVRAGFRLLALSPAGQFTVATAATLLDRPARRDIDILRELGLVEPLERGRFRMSWSVRRFAVELGLPDGAEVALGRLLAYYASRAVAADLAGGARLRYYRISETEPWPADEDRIEWLDAEAEVLADLVEFAYLRGRDDEVGQLCGAMEVLLLHRGRPELCLAAFERGVQAARRQGDSLLLARQHALCGRVATLLHRFDRAQDDLDAARAIAESSDEPGLIASIEEFTGRLAEEMAGVSRLPDWRPAIDAFTRAVEIDRRHPEQWKARGLHTRMLANVLVKAGSREQVASLVTEAMAHTLPGDDRNASRAYLVGAKFAVLLGNSDAARKDHREAERLAAASGSDQYRAELNEVLADIEWLEGDYGSARSRIAALAQAYVDQGHPKAIEYFAKLNRIPPET